MVHTSTKVIPKQTKKRAFPSVTCSICLSTFASRPKMMKHIKEEHKNTSEESESPKRKVMKTFAEFVGEEDKIEDLNKRIEEEEDDADNILMDHEETKADENPREEDLKKQISAANARMQLLEKENSKLCEAIKFFKEKGEAPAKPIQMEVVKHEGDEDLKRRIVATNTKRLELEEAN